MRRPFAGEPADWLIVGLGNPGPKYSGTRHNIGFVVVGVLAERWDLGRVRDRFAGRFVAGRVGPGGPRVALLQPQTFYNDVGRSVGPARGSLKLAPERLIVVHDEIDLPFGEVRTRLGGGLAGNKGLASVRGAVGTGEFVRVRVGVGRPDSTDPEIVSAYVLGRFRESAAEVEGLVDEAAAHVERTVLGEADR